MQRRYIRRAAETTGVGEQESHRNDDAERVLRAHRSKAAMNVSTAAVRGMARGSRHGFGELPELLTAEARQDNRVQNPDDGSVPEWLNQYTQSNFPFTTTTASEQIVPANPFRTYLLIQNKSADFMFVNFGQLATNYNGVRISPGGNYELIGGAQGGAHCPADSVNVLGNAAALEGVVCEGVWVDVAE